MPQGSTGTVPRRATERAGSESVRGNDEASQATAYLERPRLQCAVPYGRALLDWTNEPNDWSGSSITTAQQGIIRRPFAGNPGCRLENRGFPQDRAALYLVCVGLAKGGNSRWTIQEGISP